MIQEATIERILERLEADKEDLSVEIQDFVADQPHLAAYLTNEDSETLSEAERALLFFGAIVIYQSVLDERTIPGVISEEMIGQTEEENYALVAEKGLLRDRLTPLFDDSEEEELLAFAEDLIVGEAEEGGITKEAREPMFIALKTVVDCLVM